MKGKPGEITVFLSLITVCCLSLFLSLVESARTTGARLYLEMAANSAMSSVMSQYNRNLWDMYHLLFLESESEDAVIQSFESYLSFYLNQENLYPMKLEETEIEKVSYLMDFGGTLLEKEIVSYMKHGMPDIEKEMEGVSEAAEEASKAGDFRQLFDVCLRAGSQTRNLEKKRKELERCLEKVRQFTEKARTAADLEAEGKLEQWIDSLADEAAKFPELLHEYNEEVGQISDYLEELRKESAQAPENADAAIKWNQEIQAFEQIEKAAREQADRYEELEHWIDKILADGTTVLELLDVSADEEHVDWPLIQSILGEWVIPIPSVVMEEEEKTLSLNRLERLLSGGLFSLVLPNTDKVSENRVSLRGVPSEELEEMDNSPGHLPWVLFDHFIVNEYCLQTFDSFIEEKTGIPGRDEQALRYEMEYLVSGNDTDRENLVDTIESLIFIRASMNLCYLTAAPERKSEADGLALTLSGGSIPLQVILSFFILTLWSVGEALLDVRALLAGGKVPFWKTEESWKLSLEQLFALEFLDMPLSEAETDENGDYVDYLRVLCFLMDRETKNARIMDLLQWNVRTEQPDFSIADCMGEIKVHMKVANRHLFFSKEEYIQTVSATGSY